MLTEQWQKFVSDVNINRDFVLIQLHALLITIEDNGWIKTGSVFFFASIFIFISQRVEGNDISDLSPYLIYEQRLILTPINSHIQKKIFFDSLYLLTFSQKLHNAMVGQLDRNLIAKSILIYNKICGTFPLVMF